MMNCKIVQINLNHCWGAHDILQQFMKEEKVDIAMVTEPVHIPDRNWICSKNKGAAIHWSTNVKLRIKEIFKGEEFVATEVKDMVLISCYISPKASVKEFVEVLRRIDSNVKMLDFGKQVIMCGDFNAYSTLWGSKLTNGKGDRLVRWMDVNNFIVVNKGDLPTCIRPQGVSYIDLTLATPIAAKKVRDWKVEAGKLSLSDHNYITFRLEVGRMDDKQRQRNRLNNSGVNNASLRWKMETMDQGVFDEVLEWKCSMLRDNEGTEEGSDEREVEWIHQTMVEAADASMQRVKRRVNNDKGQVYWWNEEIAEKRRKCVRDRRKWTRAQTKKREKEKKQRGGEVDLEELQRLRNNYRNSRKIVTRAIYRAKEEAWKELIKEIDKDQWGTPYRVVMNKLRTAGPGLTEILEEDKVEQLVLKLFPRETGRMEDEVVNVRVWKEEWDVSTEELCGAIKRKGRNTAPGPDGITTRMWKKIPGKMVEKVTGIINKFMRGGKFPRKWKLAKLVLIPKVKNDTSNIPKARPICLIDDIGKYFERIIVGRIEDRIEYMKGKGLSFAGIGKNQYGFRKNKSTIDALSRVKEIMDEVRRDGETSVMISLDIENAFNSIPWIKIREVLKRKRMPLYLIRLLNDYFKDRYVEYKVRNGSTKRMEVQRGVPQGSVLGPLIWILVYDRVLCGEKEEGCEVIGYADDTIIISVADTYEEAKVRACMQAERTVFEIRKLGLNVAVEKTEVIVFQGKKGKRPPKDDYIRMDGKRIKIGRSVKYLGVILDSKLAFKEHFNYVYDKAEKVKRALCKLMPNLRGPHENKRRLYAYVIQSVIMYGAPIWFESFAKNLSIQRPILKLQRELAIRVVAGYRTVSYEVAILLARTPPWMLVARKYQRTYRKIKESKLEKTWSKEKEEEIKKEEELEMLKGWKERIEREDLPGPRLRAAIASCFEEWLARRHGGINFHLTQLLTGHGCFRAYLQRIKKVDSAMCIYCEKGIDNEEHTLVECEEWNRERDAMKIVLDSAINLENLVKAICYSQESWRGVNAFAQEVMVRKEEDEKREKLKNREEEENRSRRVTVALDATRGLIRDTSPGQDTDISINLDYGTEEELEL